MLLLYILVWLQPPNLCWLLKKLAWIKSGAQKVEQVLAIRHGGWVGLATRSYNTDSSGSSSISIISFLLAVVLFNPCSCPVHHDLFATLCSLIGLSWLFSVRNQSELFQLRTYNRARRHVQGVNLLLFNVGSWGGLLCRALFGRLFLSRPWSRLVNPTISPTGTPQPQPCQKQSVARRRRRWRCGAEAMACVRVAGAVAWRQCESKSKQSTEGLEDPGRPGADGDRRSESGIANHFDKLVAQHVAWSGPRQLQEPRRRQEETRENDAGAMHTDMTDQLQFGWESCAVRGSPAA
jgi:hypothetical protein